MTWKIVETWKHRLLFVAVGVLFLFYLYFSTVCCGFHVPVSAKDIMKNDLKGIVLVGFGSSEPDAVWFQVGEEILGIEVSRSTELPDSAFALACKGALCESAFSVTEKSILVKEKTEGYVVVCGDDQNDGVKYCGAVGDSAAEARDACKEKCGLE